MIGSAPSSGITMRTSSANLDTMPKRREGDDPNPALRPHVADVSPRLCAYTRPTQHNNCARTDVNIKVMPRR
jgi:hypothetical protein